MTGDFGINQGLVDELYARYVDNPLSVAASWRDYFARARGAAPLAGHGGIHSAAVTSASAPPDSTAPLSVAPVGSAAPAPAVGARSTGAAVSSTRLYRLVTAYRFLGHLYADINPLAPRPPRPPELDHRSYGLGDDDLDRLFKTFDLPGPDEQTLREVISRMEDTYCGSIGVEYRNIESTEQRHWLRDEMEGSRNHLTLNRDQQIHLLTKLSDAENLEQFIHASYAPGTKRFSLEGGESLIPLLDMIIDAGAEHGMQELVLGMAHRGRLNVLVNTLESSLRSILYAFEDKDAERYLGRGDVKYHLGYSSDRIASGGKSVHLTLTFNPSHLEFVNPVVSGRVRAKQRRHGDHQRRRIVPLLIHGDAAFVGQGVVAETLNLTGLPGYTTGGTLHIIVNNQIGFTTNPKDSRSTRYASDMMRMLNVPVFHVNGEDPEAVTQVAQLAVRYRQRFNKDVLIDLYCYRRYGHNEGDEPRFTQPQMYTTIDQKPTVRDMYVERLVSLGQVTKTEADEISARRRRALAAALDEVKKHPPEPLETTFAGVWSNYCGGDDALAAEVDTAVDRDILIELSRLATTLPAEVTPHRKIARLLKQRHQRLSENQPFDWGTAEMMAYASLLHEGTSIRMSGEDVGRGTFSHRHAQIIDQCTGEPFIPLSMTATNGARYESVNSPLSEAGVLGFDFGYSLDSPEMLVIWEAQFGDFLNSAQVIVDQFITSCEDKWQRLSGITLMLPHGYEGQGPEHSSARIERFLQNAAEDNVQICNLTTPAQLFHVLRRQVRRDIRKPLVLFTPKSMLRAAFSSSEPQPTSCLDDLAQGRFMRTIADEEVPATAARKVLLCSGKVYYDLLRYRRRHTIDDVAIVRLEQLYPLNHELDDALKPYATGTPLVWVQEEPWNFGPWFYINAVLPARLGGRLPLSWCARERSASPATGSKASHKLEQRLLVEAAFA